MQHLSYEKRIMIQHYLEKEERIYQKEIAEALGVAESTISNELSWFKRNKVLYCAKKAEEMAKERRRIANKSVHEKIQEGSELSVFIEEKIQLYRSPEQITNVWKNEKGDKLSHNTVYSYLDRGSIDNWRKRFARHKGKKQKKSTGKVGKICNRVCIEKRSKIVEKKTRLGDFEGDTIVGDNKSDCIVTIIDRVSLYSYAKVVHLNPGEDLSVIVSTFIGEILGGVKKKLRKTLTLDNGTEFADHEYITLRTGVKVYFAHPYHSRERGCNENFNGLLRQFYHKGMSFKKVKQEELDHYVQLINDRPRKKLGRKSPTDVFLP